MEDTRFSPAYRSMFSDEPEDSPPPRDYSSTLRTLEKWYPDEPAVVQPQQTFAMKFFLFSVSAICWVAIITVVLVILFFAGIVAVAISRGL